MKLSRILKEIQIIQNEKSRLESKKLKIDIELDNLASKRSSLFYSLHQIHFNNN